MFLLITNWQANTNNKNNYRLDNIQSLMTFPGLHGVSAGLSYVCFCPIADTQDKKSAKIKRITANDPKEPFRLKYGMAATPVEAVILLQRLNRHGRLGTIVQYRNRDLSLITPV